MYKPIAQLYQEHESDKKRAYEERIIESEKGTFTPLVFSTSGGMAPLCKTFFKKLAQIIADYTGEKYEEVVFNIRVRTRFALLRSTLIALRGQRGRKLNKMESLLKASFNLLFDPGMNLMILR